MSNATKYTPAEIEEKWYQYWEENGGLERFGYPIPDAVLADGVPLSRFGLSDGLPGPVTGDLHFEHEVQERPDQHEQPDSQSS